MVTRETSLSQALSGMGIPASDQDVRRLARLADLLENDAVDMGFLGPNEGQRVISRHLLESAALVHHVPPDGPIVDVGSGAGLPGLVLGALGREMVLIESQAKRARFLRDVATELGIEADVRHARAEDEGRGDLRDATACAVARALAVPAVALELCMPLVRPGGRVLLPSTPDDTARSRSDPSGPAEPRTAAREPSGPEEDTPSADGPDAPREPDQRRAAVGSSHLGGTRQKVADDALATVAQMLGGGDMRWEELPVPGADGPRWVMIVDKRDPTPDRFPRRPGVPKRRPLGGDVASVN